MHECVRMCVWIPDFPQSELTFSTNNEMEKEDGFASIGNSFKPKLE